LEEHFWQAAKLLPLDLRCQILLRLFHATPLAPGTPVNA